LRVTSAPSLIPLTAGRPVPRARRLLAGLAAAYLAVVALGLPVAKTREALNAGLSVRPPSADVDWVGNGHPPHGNPDNDFSDAIPVKGLIVFASPIPTLDVPLATPGVVVGQTDAPRPRPLRTREDFERGPPSLT
jgi:hypothetical protein